MSCLSLKRHTRYTKTLQLITANIVKYASYVIINERQFHEPNANDIKKNSKCTYLLVRNYTQNNAHCLFYQAQENLKTA